MEFLLLPLIVFLAVLTVALVLVSRHDQVSQQQMVLSRMSAPSVEVLEDIDITRLARTPESAFFGYLCSKVRLIRRFEENLWQAGLYFKASDVLALMAVLGLAGGAAGAVWSGGVNFPALVMGVGLALLPLIYVMWRKRRRLREFDQELPEILDMIKSSLDAGHTLQRALQVTVEEFSDPASSEFRIVLEQNRLGVPLARALEYMLARMPDENLRFLVVAVKIQTEVGSSLARIISQLAMTIRDRQRLEMKIRVLTAQPRIGAIAGGLMPFILLLALTFVNPEAVHMLFHDPTGIMLTKAVVVLEVLAFITVYRMMRVDY
jgi:tight adherence protein B